MIMSASRALGLMARIATSSTCAAALCACQVILPAHPQSEDVAGEKVTVELLTKADIDAQYQQDWRYAFAKDNPERELLQVEAPVQNPQNLAAAAALPFLAAFARQALEAEAAKYEAQFDEKALGDFWEYVLVDATAGKQRAVWRQRVMGMRIRRTTTSHLSVDDPAFEAVVGISKVGHEKDAAGNDTTADLRMALLHIKTAGAKAKILDTRPWSILPPLVWQYLLNTGNIVQTTVHVEVVGSGASQGPMISTDLAKVDMQLQVPTASVGWSDDAGRQALANAASAKFASPVHPDTVPDKSHPTAGEIVCHVTVTERDPSNAKKTIEKGVEWLRAQESKK